MSDEAGSAEERAAHEAKGRPSPIDEGTPTVHGPSLVQAQAEQARKGPRKDAGEEATEDMPTLPPASRGSVVRRLPLGQPSRWKSDALPARAVPDPRNRVPRPNRS